MFHELQIWYAQNTEIVYLLFAECQRYFSGRLKIIFILGNYTWIFGIFERLNCQSFKVCVCYQAQK